MNPGCLIDPNSYAMAYNLPNTWRPIIGCGVILNNGKLPIPLPMYLEDLK